MDLKDICIEIAKKYNIDSIGLFVEPEEILMSNLTMIYL